MYSDPDPSALVKRSERVLHFGEQIMQRAVDDEDFRLGLQALDRVQRSLDQLLRVHGLLNPDTPPANDNRQVNVFQNLSLDELRAAIKALSTPKVEGEEAAIARPVAAGEGRRRDSRGVLIHEPEQQPW